MRSIFLSLFFALCAICTAHAHQRQTCPPGFTDTGAHCLKPPSYGRGFGNRTLAHCELDNGVGRCEKCLSLYYPICDSSYQTRGCNVCEPKCPPNMTDIGLSCQK